MSKSIQDRVEIQGFSKGRLCVFTLDEQPYTVFLPDENDNMNPETWEMAAMSIQLYSTELIKNAPLEKSLAAIVCLTEAEDGGLRHLSQEQKDLIEEWEKRGQ